MRYQYRTEVYDMIPDDAWVLTKDGNVSYYPAFLFIPYEMLSHGGREIRDIPRCFDDLLHSDTGLSVLQTDCFLGFMLNCYSMMVWQVIRQQYKLHPVIQVYSNDNPIVYICGLINFWIEEMEMALILPTKEEFLNDPYYRYQKFEYQDFQSAVDTLTPVVLPALKKYGFDAIIEIVLDNPCHEDFSHWNSTSRIDFERRWYHSRTKLYKKNSDVQEIKENGNEITKETVESIIKGIPKETSKPDLIHVQKEPWNWNMMSFLIEPVLSSVPSTRSEKRC